MLTQAIGDLLPSAVGVALSPIPVVAVILMLGTPKARTNGPAFALGWVAGLVIVSAVVLLAANGASDSSSAAATTVNWSQVAFGAIFISMGLRQWRKRPRKGTEPEMPKWMAAIDGF